MEKVKQGQGVGERISVDLAGLYGLVKFSFTLYVSSTDIPDFVGARFVDQFQVLRMFLNILRK
jgi:hypothetical protein